MTRAYTHDQHFLKSPRLVAELIGHAKIRKNDLVYDLGAGSGIISSVLARRVRQVVAVENEPNTIKKLRLNLANFKNVTIITGDLLTLKEPEETYKIFANIPFSLSSKVVKKFTESARPPESMYLIVQKQFARKLVPGDTHFTAALSAQMSPWWFIKIKKPLRKTDFTPPPAVDTVLLEITKRQEPLITPAQAPQYRQFVDQAFARQKFFANLPRSLANISTELRPSQMTSEQWVRLYELYSKNFKA